MVLGIICIILASVTFGFAPVFSKEIQGSGMNTESMLAITSGFTVIVTGIAILIGRVKPKVTKKQVWQMAVFCGGGFGLTILLLCNSYRFLPIGLSTMFHFIYPVIVIVIMTVFFKERITIIKVVAILVALIGLYLILDISGGMSLVGVVLAVGSGFAYAIYVVAGRKCEYRELPVVITVFSTVVVSFLGFSIIQLATGNMMLPPTPRVWLLIAGNSIISNLFALVMLTCAVRRLGASNTAIGNMLEPLTSLIAGSMIYGDIIPLVSIGGCVLILIAILLIAIGEKRASKGRIPPNL